MLTLLIADTDPDIMRTIHLVLLNLHHSDLNQNGQLKIMVHFRGDKATELDSRSPVPQDYQEFDEGFKKLERVDADFAGCLDILGANKVVVMSPEGKQRDLFGVFKETGDEVTVVVGGFTEGDYVSKVYGLADFIVSLGDRLLKIPDVVNQVTENYEKAFEE